MKILITGSDGFIAKNLSIHLAERADLSLIRFSRDNDISILPDLIRESDFIFHLAGVNRSLDDNDFNYGNVQLTRLLCEAIVTTGRSIPIVYSSSIQAVNNTPYGISKKISEDLLKELSKNHAVPIYIYRLQNVFGKWAKPNYNSVVATFCHNIATDIPIEINDASSLIPLVYIDDVVESFVKILKDGHRKHYDYCYKTVETQYSITVKDLAELIQSFRKSRLNLVTERVGQGLVRALYSTYISYLPKSLLVYEVKTYEDSRGVFVEMLKTPDCGQISYFTSHPGITRGSHYHHSKSEKFLVIKGNALFKFKNLLNNEAYEMIVKGGGGLVVETIPGWAHEITNIGSDEMCVMLWASEIFDLSSPDTYPYKL